MTGRGRSPGGVVITPALLCRDRAVGHDWDALRWVDGPDLRRGRRTVYVTWRLSRCTRCTTERREVFEQRGRELVKIENRYDYADGYHDLGRVTQAQVHAALWRASKES